MAIQAVALQRHFDSAGGTVRAVDGITLDVPDKTFLAVIGRSGSGKSTLLALLGALDKPTRGRLVVNEHDLHTLGEPELVQYRRRQVGFVFQDHGLIPDLTAAQNVMLPMEFAGIPRRERLRRAKHLLDVVGLDAGKQSRRPRHLSGGEQQRVAIARALANGPRVILADEPTGNLDEENAQRIVGLLRQCVERFGVTVVLVTHDRDLAAQADLLLEMRDGKVLPAKAESPAKSAVVRKA